MNDGAPLGSLDDSRARVLAEEALGLVRELYPVCRSITGAGVRQTFDRLDRVVRLERHEVATGTPLFDWEVPREWSAREAWITGPDGRRIVDFRDHSLHLVSYSSPFRGRLPLEALQPHLHSLPDAPDWIPYRTSYYSDTWGFCLRHRDRQRLVPGEYDVCVDTSLEPGSLSYAEAYVPGTTEREALVYTHSCHPSLANDNLTGLAVAALLAGEMRPHAARLSFRFVFGPGTIGSLAWLAANEHRLERIECGLVVGLLGDAAPLTYKRSRRGNSVVDRAATCLLPRLDPAVRLLDFEPYGYDERQFCSPGFDLPVGRLTRSMNGGYAEYHTSADDPGLLRSESLAGSMLAIARLFDALDANATYCNLSPKGEPKLGKRGLYGSLGGLPPGESQSAMLWVLNHADGTRDLLSIVERSGLPFPLVRDAAAALTRAGLLAHYSSSSGDQP